MKKTLITLVALSASAFAAYTEPWTVSTDKEVNGQDVANGFIMKLSDSFLTSTAPDTVETLGLQAVTLQSSNNGGSFDNKVKMVIFRRPGADKVGTFVGLSDNVVTFGTGIDLKFEFTDVSLDKDTQYQFFFVTSNTTADAFSTTENNIAAYYGAKASFRFDRATCGVPGAYLPEGDGITWTPASDGTSGYSGWSGQNNAYVTFTVTPEPATATLSLLALAGLASRRRRH